MDDFLDATEKTVDSNAGNCEILTDVDMDVKGYDPRFKQQ